LEASVEIPGLLQQHESVPARMSGEVDASFQDRFVELFDAHFQRIYRVLDRLSGEPELATDLAQDAFVRLYRRGSLPDKPEAWLIAVAMNLFRNVKSTRKRRLRLLSSARGEAAHSDPPDSPADQLEADAARRRVRDAIDGLPERDRKLLLLRAEGYSYRDIAHALRLNEASVGTLLARARTAFRSAYEDGDATRR
jgi:RNA polymerase sigma factor (sigma-70 family)